MREDPSEVERFSRKDMVEKSVGTVRSDPATTHAAIDFHVDWQRTPQPDRRQSIDLIPIHDDQFKTTGREKSCDRGIHRQLADGHQHQNRDARGGGFDLRSLPQTENCKFFCARTSECPSESLSSQAVRIGFHNGTNTGSRTNSPVDGPQVAGDRFKVDSDVAGLMHAVRCSSRVCIDSPTRIP